MQGNAIPFPSAQRKFLIDSVQEAILPLPCSDAPHFIIEQLIQRQTVAPMKIFARFAVIISLFAVYSSSTPSSPSSSAPSVPEDRWLNGSAGHDSMMKLAS